MGAHRGCSEHRTVDRQQRQFTTTVLSSPTTSVASSRPDNTTTTITTPRAAGLSKPSPTTPGYRYPEPDTPFVMDEKHGYPGYRLASPPPSYPMTSRVTRRKGLVPVLAMAALLSWSCWGYLRLPTVPAPARTGLIPDGAPAAAVKDLVPLEAHIMSKCPDARDCLRDLVLPTMMKVQNKVNFTLSYIGT
ncbi:hypothetical protein CTA2_625 [Colletotrichum tanaceti]|nr:hypothetical protein CTA2_625 [Colletotrichum tanaceti]